jgi:hypothetical protein
VGGGLLDHSDNGAAGDAALAQALTPLARGAGAHCWRGRYPGV